VDWLRIPLAALEPQGRALVVGDGHEIAVFRVEEEVYAVENTCPHEGNPLVEGEVLGGNLTCAYHGWTFDLASGFCLVGTEPVRRYPAEVHGDEVWIRVET
jgi:nitrite reductase/ring-hydroxylating ferredoxin subunit